MPMRWYVVGRSRLDAGLTRFAETVNMARARPGDGEGAFRVHRRTRAPIFAAGWPEVRMTAIALGSPSIGQALAALRAAIIDLARMDATAVTPVTPTAPVTPKQRAAPGSTGQRAAPPSPRVPEQPSPDDQPGEVWAIVERAQAGDPEAFGELYDQYIDVVFRYVHVRVGSRSQAEDLTSETFVRALRGICGVTWQGRDLGAWLVTIARNIIADHYKSARYRLEISTADMLDADRAEDGPENDVLDAMTSACLLEAVKKLKPEQQECIVLRFLQGMSVAETAAVMGKKDGAIKALQYRAIRTLGRLLPEGFVR